MSELKEIDREKLADLLAKVSASTGPDHDLDAEVWLATVPGATRKNLMAEWPEEAPLWEYHDAERNTLFRAGLLPPLTASIDAALALVERMQPGQQWVVARRAMTQISDDHSRLVSGIDLSRELPLAILAALLSALSSIKEVGK